MNWENYDVDDRSGILVLPSTVTSIEQNGLYKNNMIKTIYYCGSTNLSNSSQLVDGVSEPDIKVTNSYTFGTIFGSYTSNTTIESIAEAKEKCNSFEYKPETTAATWDALRPSDDSIPSSPSLASSPSPPCPSSPTNSLPRSPSHSLSPSLDPTPLPTLTLLFNLSS